jgi:tripartite-type tricarboxylate transporter receptor subunit TctC
LNRRRFVGLAAAFPLFPSLQRSAAAQTYPTRPIRWLVGFPPGGAADIVVRLVAGALSERLGQTVVVDNRPGAGTNLATEAATRASPDGYTLLLVTPANATNATLYEKLPFDFLRDIAPVAGLNRSPIVLVVNPSTQFTSAGELVAYAKANPGKLTLATGTNGTANQMTQGLFRLMAGIDTVEVPYRGEAPAITDLLAGQVQGMFVTLTSCL